WSEMSQHMVYCLSDQICGGHREASFAVGDGRLYPAVFEPERDIDGIPGLERGTETKVRNYFVAVQLHHPAFPIVFLELTQEQAITGTFGHQWLDFFQLGAGV